MGMYHAIRFFNYFGTSWLCLVLWLSLTALSEQQSDQCISATKLYDPRFFSHNNVSYAGWYLRSEGWDVVYYSGDDDPLKAGTYYGDLPNFAKVDSMEFDQKKVPRGRIFLYEHDKFYVFYVSQKNLLKWKRFQFLIKSADQYGLHSDKGGSVKLKAPPNDDAEEYLKYIVGYKGSFVDTKIKSCSTVKDDETDRSISITTSTDKPLREFCKHEQDKTCKDGNCVFDLNMKEVHGTKDDKHAAYQFRSQTAIYCNIFRVDQKSTTTNERLIEKDSVEKPLTVTKQLRIFKNTGFDLLNCVEVDDSMHPGQFYWKGFIDNSNCQYLPKFITVKSEAEENLEEIEKKKSENIPVCPDTFMTNIYVTVLIFAFGAVMTFMFGLMICLGRVGRKRRIKNEMQKRVDMGATTSCYTMDASQTQTQSAYTQPSQMTVVV